MLRNIDALMRLLPDISTKNEKIYMVEHILQKYNNVQKIRKKISTKKTLWFTGISKIYFIYYMITSIN